MRQGSGSSSSSSSSSTLQASRIPTGQLQHTHSLAAGTRNRFACLMSFVLTLLIKAEGARQRSKHCMVQKEMRFQPPARSYLTGVRGRDDGRRRGLEHKERHGRRAHRTITSRTKFSSRLQPPRTRRHVTRYTRARVSGIPPPSLYSRPESLQDIRGTIPQTCCLYRPFPSASHPTIP